MSWHDLVYLESLMVLVAPLSVLYIQDLPFKELTRIYLCKYRYHFQSYYRLQVILCFLIQR